MMGLKETIDLLMKANSACWYGHVLRKEKNIFLRRGLDFKVKRNKRRPKKTWLWQLQHRLERLGRKNNATNVALSALAPVETVLFVMAPVETVLFVIAPVETVLFAVTVASVDAVIVVVVVVAENGWPIKGYKKRRNVIIIATLNYEYCFLVLSFL